MGKGKPPRDAGRIKRHMNKGSANVPALLKERFLVAQEQRGLVRAGVEVAEVLDELARLGGVATQTFMRVDDNGNDLKLDPDEMHRRKLLAHRDMLATLLKSLALPKAARFGLRQLVMDIHDFLDGRQSRVLAPMPATAKRPADPLRDWMARATLAILAEREKRQRPSGDQNDKAAYLALLPRVEKELRPFGVSVEDVLPGKRPTRREGADRDEEEWTRNQMFERVAGRCVGHKASLDGGEGYDSIPSLARKAFEMAIADLDQVEGAGKLRPVTDDEIADMALELRLSFDRADYERLLDHNAAKLAAAS